MVIESKYTVKRINDAEILHFETIAEIERTFDASKLSECFKGSTRRLFPKEIEWIEVDGERVYNCLESNRSYIVYKDGHIKAFNTRLELEQFLNYGKGEGNVWVKEGFPTALDSNIDFLHLKGKRSVRKRAKYSFALLNGERFETNNKKEVAKFFGVDVSWSVYYDKKRELPPAILKQILNYELTE